MTQEELEKKAAEAANEATISKPATSTAATTLDFFIQGKGDAPSASNNPYINTVTATNDSQDDTVTDKVYESLKTNPNANVTLVGYSMGSTRATHDAAELIGNNVNVSTLVYLDNADNGGVTDEELTTIKQNGTNLIMFKTNKSGSDTTSKIASRYNTYNSLSGDGTAYVINCTNYNGSVAHHQTIDNAYYEDWSDFLNGKSSTPNNIENYSVTYIDDSGKEVTLSGQEILEEINNNPSFMRDKTAMLSSSSIVVPDTPVTEEGILSDMDIANAAASTIASTTRQDSLYELNATTYNFSTTKSYSAAETLMNQYTSATSLLLQIISKQAENIEAIAEELQKIDSEGKSLLESLGISNIDENKSDIVIDNKTESTDEINNTGDASVSEDTSTDSERTNWQNIGAATANGAIIGAGIGAIAALLLGPETILIGGALGAAVGAIVGSVKTLFGKDTYVLGLSEENKEKIKEVATNVKSVLQSDSATGVAANIAISTAFPVLSVANSTASFINNISTSSATTGAVESENEEEIAARN